MRNPPGNRAGMTLLFPTPENRVDATLAFNAGVQAMQQGDDATAVAHWQRATELDATLVPAIHNLIVYHEDREQFEKVAELYAMQIALNPFDTRALIRQAASLRRLRRYGAAVSNYEKAIGFYPWFRFWYEELAQILDEAGQPEIASEWRARSEAIDSDEAEMACEDGTRQLRKGNHPLARACFEAVLEEFPNNLDVRLKLAQTLHEMGDTDAALKEFDNAMRIAGTAAAVVHFHRARVFLEVGRHQDAANDLQTALELEPGFGRANYLLQQIDLSLADHETIPPNAALNSSPRRTQNGNTSPTAARNLSPWEEPLMNQLRELTAKNKSAGSASRFALIVEPHASLAPAAMRLADMLHALELPSDGGRILPVMVVETEARTGEGMIGVNRVGWLGSDSVPDMRVVSWNPVTDGLPVDQSVLAAVNAVPEGFTALILVTTGRARGDQAALSRLVRGTTSLAWLVLSPAGNPGDVAARLKPIAPGFRDYVID
jgi:tetratricopeptide (TPR) repeat protein